MNVTSSETKGPASLAGDPDHGSTNPQKDQEMNVSNLSAGAARAKEKRIWWSDLEDRIGEIRKIAAIGSRLAELQNNYVHEAGLKQKTEHPMIIASSSEVDQICFMLGKLNTEIRELEQDYRDLLDEEIDNRSAAEA